MMIKIIMTKLNNNENDGAACVDDKTDDEE